jgi:hypothetical protein
MSTIGELIGEIKTSPVELGGKETTLKALGDIVLAVTDTQVSILMLCKGYIEKYGDFSEINFSFEI